MFAYDTTFISSLLKCQRCSTNYNEYNEPRSLPCCGKTICSRCIEPLEKTSINAMFTCNMCNKKSLLNPNGFPINEVVAKIVSEQPKEVYRGKEIQQLKTDIDTLENLNKQLFYEKNNSSINIDAHCDEQSELIRAAAENLIQEINKERDQLLNNVNDYKQKSKQDFLEKKPLSDKTNEIINRVNGFLEGNFQIYLIIYL